MTATLGPFTEGFASWRRILGSAPPEVQLKVFSNAVEDVASFIARGLDRAIAADELVDMAISIGFDDHDLVQDVIARAFSRADSEAESGIDWEKLNDRKRERGHGGNGRASPSGEEGKIKRFAAVPYSWRNPATIPSREFLFARHYVRNNMGATIGAGGRAKTTYGLAEFVFMACGRNQMTGEQIEPLRVWYLNGEEDQDELDRRVAAICQHYKIEQIDCGDRLFVQSVRDDPMRFAVMDKNGRPSLDRELFAQFEAGLKAKQFDVWAIDPLISFHSVNESSNEHMDLLIKEGLGRIASRTNTAGELFHHPGKPKPGQAETTVEDARGASAVIWAVRSARVLNFMTPQEAERIGIGEDDRRLHIRIANGKANMGPVGKATWIKIAVENLPNGDEIACASWWKPPDPFKNVTTADMHKCRELRTGAYRLDSRSRDWIGFALADILKINVAHGAENNPHDLVQIKQVLRTWLKNKVLATIRREDGHRKERMFVVPGDWKEEPMPDYFDPDPEVDEVILQ